MYAAQINTMLIRERRTPLVRELLSELHLSDIEWTAMNEIRKHR